MKIRFRIKSTIKNYIFLLICLFVFFFQSYSQVLNALTMENSQNNIVIEELRLKVPSKFKYGLRLKTKFGSLGYLCKRVFWGDKFFGIKKRRSFNIG